MAARVMVVLEWADVSPPRWRWHAGPPASACRRRTARTGGARRALGRIQLQVACRRVRKLAHGRAQGVVALASLLVEALLDLLGEVVAVVLRHEHANAVHELFVRVRVARQHRSRQTARDLAQTARHRRGGCRANVSVGFEIAISNRDAMCQNR